VQTEHLRPFRRGVDYRDDGVTAGLYAGPFY